jgi:bifunctional DNA-binding transcriptional regulator/antitoxin component of YhaV-PrlF toxin-antitoxin module
VRLRERNQLTLPTEIAEKLSVEPGSLLELVLSGDHVELRHAQVVRAGTPEAKRAEERAREDIREGRFLTFANPDEFALYMKQTREQETKELQLQVEALQEQVQGIVQNMRRMSAATGVPVADLPLDLSSKA